MLSLSHHENHSLNIQSYIFKMLSLSWSCSTGQKICYLLWHFVTHLLIFLYQVRVGHWKPSPYGPCCLITQINITSTMVLWLPLPALKWWSGLSLKTLWPYQKHRSVGLVTHTFTYTGVRCHQCSFLELRKKVHYSNVGFHSLMWKASFEISDSIYYYIDVASCLIRAGRLYDASFQFLMLDTCSYTHVVLWNNEKEAFICSVWCVGSCKSH